MRAKENSKAPLYCFIVVIMIIVGRTQEIFPFLWNLHLAKIALFIAISLYLLNPSRNSKDIMSLPQVKSLLLLFTLGWISTPFSYWPSGSLDFMAVSFISVLAIALLAIKLVNTHEDARLLSLGVVTTIGIVTFSSLLNYETGERATLEGTAYDTNDLAALLIIFLPLVYFMMKAETGWKRLACGGILCASLLLVLGTQSRGGFLGLVVIVLAILIRERVHTFYILVLAILAVALLGAFAPAAYRERISSMLNPSEDYNLTAHSGRVAVWKRGLAIMAKNPLLGAGPGVFAVAEGKSHTDTGGKWSAAHNSFIQIGAEFGVIGLWLFIQLIYLSIKNLRELRKKVGNSWRAANIANGIEIGFYGYLTTGFFLSMAYSASLYLLIGMSVALATNIADT